jgi:hypothetical protein
MPTAQLVGASRLSKLRRPWNPHAYIAFGFKPEEFETPRFTDADADYIAAAYNSVPLLIQTIREQQKVIAGLNVRIENTALDNTFYCIACLCYRPMAGRFAADRDEGGWLCGHHSMFNSLANKHNTSRDRIVECINCHWQGPGKYTVAEHTTKGGPTQNDTGYNYLCPRCNGNIYGIFGFIS